MSYASIIRAAADQAQSIIAKLQGMPDTGTANFQYGTEFGIGVFGAAQIVEVPQPSGGYRRRAQLNLSVTRTQTQFSFEPKTRLVRLAMGNAPSVTYVIDIVDTHDPLVWMLTIVRSGE